MDKLSRTNVTISTGTIFVTFIIAVSFGLVWYLRDILLVLITAIVIASAIEPGTNFLEKHRFPRALAVLTIYLSVIGIFLGLFYAFFPLLLKDLINLVNELPNYTQSTTVWNPLQDSSMSGLNQLFSVRDVLNGISQSLITASQGFFSTVSGLFGGIVSFALIVVLSFYLAVQRSGIENLLRIVLPIQHEEYAISLWKRSQHKIGLWLQGQLVLSILVMFITYPILAILGVKNALFLSIIAGAFEIIPVFGIILATIPAVAVALSQGGWTLALIVLGVYLIVHQFENHLFYPLVVKKVVGIPPILTIITLLIGAKLAGFLGILLSIPMAAVIMEILNDIESRKFHKPH